MFVPDFTHWKFNEAYISEEPEPVPGAGLAEQMFFRSGKFSPIYYG
jgi:hypothetical protein